MNYVIYYCLLYYYTISYHLLKLIYYFMIEEVIKMFFSFVDSKSRCSDLSSNLEGKKTGFASCLRLNGFQTAAT